MFSLETLLLQERGGLKKATGFTEFRAKAVQEAHVKPAWPCSRMLVAGAHMLGDPETSARGFQRLPTFCCSLYFSITNVIILSFLL